MSNEEKIIDLQRHSAVQDARIDSFEQKFQMFIQEIRDFKAEMRDRDNQRAAEIHEMNQRFYNKIDSLESKFDTKIDSIGRHVQNLTITAMIGIGAMAAAVIYSTLSR